MSTLDDLWDWAPDYDDFESDVDVTCKFCRRAGFHWGEHWKANGDVRWRLYTASGRLHNCRIVTPDPNGFDVVPG